MQNRHLAECRRHLPAEIASPKTPLFFRSWLLNRRLSQTFPFPEDPSAPLAHMKRVGRLSELLSETLDPDQTKVNRLTGQMHDIGKAMIPDAVTVLTYSGKLSIDRPDWWQQILMHPGYSVDLLLSYMPEIAILILENVLHHHEKRDGSGYPDGLTDNEIPFGASIIAVADTFDAMTVGGNFRSYGNPVTQAESIEFMLTGDKYHQGVVKELQRLTSERRGHQRIAAIYRGT